MGSILMGSILMGTRPDGVILAGCILAGFILLYVRMWQTGGDVVLQDFSFQPQKPGCRQKVALGASPAVSPPQGDALGKVPPAWAAATGAPPGKHGPKTSQSLEQREKSPQQSRDVPSATTSVRGSQHCAGARGCRDFCAPKAWAQ